jgi:hypothetical protein
MWGYATVTVLPHAYGFAVGDNCGGWRSSGCWTGTWAVKELGVGNLGCVTNTPGTDMPLAALVIAPGDFVKRLCWGLLDYAQAVDMHALNPVKRRGCWKLVVLPCHVKLTNQLSLGAFLLSRQQDRTQSTWMVQSFVAQRETGRQQVPLGSMERACVGTRGSVHRVKPV